MTGKQRPLASFWGAKPASTATNASASGEGAASTPKKRERDQVIRPAPPFPPCRAVLCAPPSFRTLHSPTASVTFVPFHSTSAARINQIDEPGIIDEPEIQVGMRYLATDRRPDA